jgi:hypothetical protein
VAKPKNKHIFCIEGNWDPDLSVKSTVRPMLELLDATEGVKFVHRDAATPEEFEFLVGKWRQKSYAAYRILYLAFHGYEGRLSIYGSKEMSLDDLAGLLERQCYGRVIYLGACSVLRLGSAGISAFLNRTGAQAVCGYTKDVDWTASTALDLLVMSTLQERSFDRSGLLKARAEVRRDEGRLVRKLGFRMHVR